MNDYFFKKLLNKTLDAPIFKNLKPFSKLLLYCLQLIEILHSVP